MTMTDRRHYVNTTVSHCLKNEYLYTHFGGHIQKRCLFGEWHWRGLINYHIDLWPPKDI